MNAPDLRVMTDHLDELMTLLAVARLGRYTAAAESLGVNHSTVSRRISSLERALGGRVMLRAASGWALRPDMSLARGDCRVETEQRAIDATGSDRWTRLLHTVGHGEH